MILGSAVLSMELFGLRLLQMLEKTTGSWYSSVWAYAQEPIILLSLGITVCIILISAVSLIYKTE